MIKENIHQLLSNKIQRPNPIKIIIFIETLLIIALIFYIKNKSKPIEYTITTNNQDEYYSEKIDKLEKEVNNFRKEKEASDYSSEVILNSIRPINQDTFVYTKINANKRIVVLNKNNTDLYEIDEGRWPSVSNDKQRIAYVKHDNTDNICIYDIKTKLIQKVETDFEALTSVDWSPNDQYLVVNTGSDVVRNITIYDYKNRKRIINFSLFSYEGKLLTWIDNDKILFNEPQKVVPERPYGSSEGTNISIISLSSDKKIILKKADGLSDYNVLAYLNGTIYFAQNSIKEINDQQQWDKTWLDDSKVSKTFWKMNINGEGLQEIKKEDIPELI